MTAPVFSILKRKAVKVPSQRAAWSIWIEMLLSLLSLGFFFLWGRQNPHRHFPRPEKRFRKLAVRGGGLSFLVAATWCRSWHARSSRPGRVPASMSPQSRRQVLCWRTLQRRALVTYKHHCYPSFIRRSFFTGGGNLSLELLSTMIILWCCRPEHWHPSL